MADIIKKVKIGSTEYDLQAAASSVTRALESIYNIAAASASDTETVWFGGSDAVTTAKMPKPYCIVNIKRGNNARGLMDCYCLTDGTHYIDYNIDVTNSNTWSGWILQPSFNDLEEYIKSLSDLGITATVTELNYVDGVTSNIQTQLNNKVPTSRTVNGKALSANITLSASDVSAYSKTEINNMAFITVDDIDAICGTTIQVATASEVTF